MFRNEAHLKHSHSQILDGWWRKHRNIEKPGCFKFVSNRLETFFYFMKQHRQLIQPGPRQGCKRMLCAGRTRYGMICFSSSCVPVVSAMVSSAQGSTFQGCRRPSPVYCDVCMDACLDRGISLFCSNNKALFYFKRKPLTFTLNGKVSHQQEVCLTAVSVWNMCRYDALCFLSNELCFCYGLSHSLLVSQGVLDISRNRSSFISACLNVSWVSCFYSLFDRYVISN